MVTIGIFIDDGETFSIFWKEKQKEEDKKWRGPDTHPPNKNVKQFDKEKVLSKQKFGRHQPTQK